ncbi:MAG: 3'-5' exonuclease [Chloroflexota bacterium]
MTETVIVIDFETTGLSPFAGARATEVAAVRIVGNEIADSFQSLMNSGARVPQEIVRLTGITDTMLRTAPPAQRVMRQLLDFVGTAPLVAHNASFDRSFFESECGHAGLKAAHSFTCTMKLARRVYPRSPNFKLKTLLEYADIPHSEKMHRAMADAVATARLWLQMQQDLCSKYRLDRLGYNQVERVTKLRIADVARTLGSWGGKTDGHC